MRAAYRDIELYDPRRTTCEVDLSDNTNLFGVPPAARRALATLESRMISRYPSVYGDRLKAAIARLHGVDPENVATGCGSDDVIDSAIRAFCEPGHAVAYPDPTFGVVATFARMSGAVPLAVPMNAGGVDVEALCAAAARVTYVCSPNNPTGAAVRAESLELLDRELRGVLLLDEAYADFSGGSRASLSARSSRTVSVRTLSKAYGLAGLRIGYAVGPREIVREIEKSRGPYKLSTAAEAAACAALAEDGGWVAEHVAAVLENRDRLTAELVRRGAGVSPSDANFLLIRLPAGATAAGVTSSLLGDGVGVRAFPALPGLGDCIRVTVGPWPLMVRFLDALDQALALEAA